MKLTDSERAIIAAVLFDADLPLAVLARDIRMTPSTARTTLRRLVERKILRYYPFINVYPLGYVPYQIYFTPAAAKRTAIIEYLRGHSSVSWLIRTSGAYEYCAAILCRTPFDLNRILEEMGARLGATFLERAPTAQTRLSLLEPKFLFERNGRDRFVTWSAPQKLAPPLDALDHHILAGLIQNHYESGRDLSRQLQIPSSTFAQRVKALCTAGIIEHFVYIVNFEALGCRSYKILVSARTTHPDFREELWQLARRHPYSYTFTECIGPWDFEIDLRCPSAEIAEHLVETLSRHFKKLVASARILRYEERIKLACYPFAAPQRT